MQNLTQKAQRRPLSEDVDAVVSLKEKGKTHQQIADEIGINAKRVQHVLALAKKQSSEPQSEEIEEIEKPEKEKKKPIRISRVDEIDADLEKGVVHRFILTSAQDDTPIFEPFWKNLIAFSEFMDAPIGVGGYTYQLGLYEDHAVATASYAFPLLEHLNFDRVRLTDDLLWIGDANILPTTANPLNGWTTANRGQHVIVPHARVALESIPRIKGQPPRFAISTGTVTEPSYTPRASGRKAIFHHTYGALLVEIDTDGECFFRHLMADTDGSFQDLDVIVKDGQIQSGEHVDSITWGDIHYEQMNPTIALASWGYHVETRQITTQNNIIDLLKPRHQFLHDTLDFRRRNHHSIRDPHQRALVVAGGSECVEDEVIEAAHFANAVQRPWCKTIMVESNHDAALARWLKDIEGASDPHNAYYWHALNAEWHQEIRTANDNFNVVERAMRWAGLADNIEFLHAGGSYIINGVESGMHGDLGNGGSPGSPNQFRKLGVQTSSGHTHSPKIVDGVYVAGVSANLDQKYNKGLTTWAHAHIVQYANGKRTLLILSADGRAGAVGDWEPTEQMAA